MSTYPTQCICLLHKCPSPSVFYSFLSYPLLAILHPLKTPLSLTKTKEIIRLSHHSPDGTSITFIIQALNGTDHWRIYVHYCNYYYNYWSYAAFVVSSFSSAARWRTTRDLEDGMLSFSASSSTVTLWSWSRTAPCIPEFFRFPAYSYKRKDEIIRNNIRLHYRKIKY